MTKYRVYLVTTATTTVEVEAEDGDQAVEKAFETDLPYAPGFAAYQFGDWTTSSELFPGSKPEDDYEEVTE